MSEEKLVKMNMFVSPYIKGKLSEYCTHMKIPLYRLVALALDNELTKDKPFDNFIYTLPTDETREYAYIDQASRILKYMKDYDDVTIDHLISIRFDIDIPDKEEVLYAFKECINKGFVEAYKPKPNVWRKFDYPEDYYFYRLAGKARNTREQRKIRKKLKDIKTYEKIKKEIERGKL